MSGGCAVCRLLRTVILAALMGGVGGYVVALELGPGTISMLVTFFGALLPVLWYLRDRNKQ